MTSNGFRFIGVGLYTVPEASRLSRVSTGRIRRWLRGYSFTTPSGRHLSPPVFPPPSLLAMAPSRSRFLISSRSGLWTHLFLPASAGRHYATRTRESPPHWAHIRSHVAASSLTEERCSRNSPGNAAHAQITHSPT